MSSKFVKEEKVTPEKFLEIAGRGDYREALKWLPQLPSGTYLPAKLMFLLLVSAFENIDAFDALLNFGISSPDDIPEKDLDKTTLAYLLTTDRQGKSLFGLAYDQGKTTVLACLIKHCYLQRIAIGSDNGSSVIQANIKSIFLEGYQLALSGFGQGLRQALAPNKLFITYHLIYVFSRAQMAATRQDGSIITLKPSPLLKKYKSDSLEILSGIGVSSILEPDQPPGNFNACRSDKEIQKICDLLGQSLHLTKQDQKFSASLSLVGHFKLSPENQSVNNHGIELSSMPPKKT